MWEMLPIQRTPGRAGTMINRDFQYETFPDVKTDFWKNVPTNVQEWCISIWQDEFTLRRQSVGQDDILAWVPKIGILVAKLGGWVGKTKSFRVIAMCFNYVERSSRGKGWSGKMITSLAARTRQEWGVMPFIFEIQGKVPRGLQEITPFLTFTYTWIPFLSVQVPPKWTSIPTTEFGFLPGFHPREYTGYKAFIHDGNRVLLDPHNDIIYYDDLVSLCSFDGLPIPGSYARVFSPLGTTQVFLENMYFDPQPPFDHFILP